MTIRLTKKQWERSEKPLPRNVQIAKQKSKRVRVVSPKAVATSFKGTCADCGSGSFALENGRCPECVRVVSKKKAEARRK